MSEHKISIPSMIYNAAVGGHVTNSQQIIDESLNREQNDINQETVGAVPYNSTTPNGMGRIVLKKNDNFKQVVEAQTNGNTIFVIKYDFTLTDDVTIPVNCIFQFDGGSISGTYTITGQNTCIKAELVQIFNTNVTLAGTWNAIFNIEWFGAKGDGVTDNSTVINSTIIQIPPKSTIKFNDGIFNTSKTIILDSRNILLTYNSHIVATQNMDYLILFTRREGNAWDFCKLYIQGGFIDGGNYADTVIGVDGIVEACIRYLNINGGINYGICTKPISNFGYTHIENCYLYNKNGNNSCIGIKVNPDDYVFNCSIRDYHIGVYSRGNVKMTHVNPWLSPGASSTLFNDSICFYVEGTDNEFTECTADTYKTGWFLVTNTTLRATNITYMCNLANIKPNYIFDCESDNGINVDRLNIYENSSLYGFKNKRIGKKSSLNYSYKGMNNKGITEFDSLLEDWNKGSYDSFNDKTKYIIIGLTNSRINLFTFIIGSGSTENEVCGQLLVSCANNKINYKKITWLSDSTTEIYYKHYFDDKYLIAVKRKPYALVDVVAQVASVKEFMGEVDDISTWTQMTF